ncbi:uncharacterized protein PITG_06516 [Phytophthora infestans T30-4]|uniref:Uncharacterized protein n=1 Tax=Phytophthora infestans (strain T30-4) TaxID=403677 RepID=D0N512_PHYIT|nr:uncharacterized protein PITG_06516 [Phytophthora infestans T30-4]EEY69970.1 conserved hypothetical protein [Phytophthora infestans T30-4]|eukprot:XP_002998617.1 conserved hypothetical protein [Phytophthora infestans T30-4]
MNYIDAARRAPWVAVYLAAGVGVLVNLLGEAYSNALDVCEMYPHFSFQETMREELSMHHTRLPLVRVHVPTLHLLVAYIAAYAAKHWGLLDRSWPLLRDLLSGRWLYHQLFECPSCYNDACNEALAKLVQVKMQHANRTIARPDDWLVFDPVQEELYRSRVHRNQ